MKRLLPLAALLAVASANAADIRIYPSFTEVRESVTSTGNTLTVTLPQEAWNGVIPGSLDLEGLTFSSAVQKLEPNWLTMLEGKTVYLKREDGKTEPVTLVRARDLLVKDAAGKFFTVRYEDLQFEVLPPTNPLSPSRTLVYSLNASGNGTLSYLTRAVTWQPRYTLKASDAGANLTALADIRNDADLPYDIKSTELYAGDVNVQGNPYADVEQRAFSAVTDARAPMGPAGPAGKIQSAGDLRGLYKYTLSSAFTLPASSVVTLPFITPKLTTFERFARLETYFIPDTRDGNLNRAYRFKADERLPAGPVTVREEGRIVGQTSLQDTPKGGKIEFVLGDDPDVTYTRSVQTVTQVRNAQGNVTRSTYKVTYTLENARSKTVRAEITERVGGRLIFINQDREVQNQGQYILKVDLPGGGKVTRTFDLVIDNS